MKYSIERIEINVWTYEAYQNVEMKSCENNYYSHSKQQQRRCS